MGTLQPPLNSKLEIIIILIVKECESYLICVVSHLLVFSSFAFSGDFLGLLNAILGGLLVVYYVGMVRGQKLYIKK